MAPVGTCKTFTRKPLNMRDNNFLNENNAKYVWHPMANAGEMRANPPRIIQSGDGVHITDLDGHRVIDAVGGLWNVNLGYSCDVVKQAVWNQMSDLPYYSTFRGTTNAPTIELSWELAQFFKPEGLTRAFFTSGGSDSVETALRLARQYHKIKGNPERVKYVALKKGYHGTHVGSASVNGNANFRRAYEPLLPGIIHLPAPSDYRNPWGLTDGAEIARRIAADFEDEIAFQGADTIAAFIMEPVLGAGGVIVPHASFMPLMRAICDKHGILLIADEVITAFGRTGAWNGSRLWGVQPDMMCTAKAITNGYFPFGAVMIHEKLTEAFETSKSPLAAISHGYTYSGHPVGAAAALACLAEIKRQNLAANAAARGDELLAGLQALKAKHTLIGDARGKGLMCAVELVADHATKAAPAKEVVQKVQDAAYADGVMMRTSGANIILSPPLIVTTSEVQKILSALSTGLTEAAK